MKNMKDMKEMDNDLKIDFIEELDGFEFVDDVDLESVVGGLKAGSLYVER
nr:hypothetical protein [uncultured Anaerosporobacter sp.]